MDDPTAPPPPSRPDPTPAPDPPAAASHAGTPPNIGPGASRGGLRPVLWIPVVVVALDQATKAMVRAWIPLHENRQVVAGWLDLTHVQNTGAAFGVLNAVEFPFKSYVLAAVAALALAGIAAYAAHVPPSQWLARAGLVLIVGGAAGNLIDRVAFGFVLDFVDVYWRGWHFWAFNVADSAITCGVVLMIADLLGLGSHVSSTA